MNVWRKGNELLFFIEHKQNSLQRDISNDQRVIKQLDDRIAVLMDEYAENVLSIKALIPAGLVSRSEMYQGIRRQGVLLSQQQLLLHQISELEAQRLLQQEILKQHLKAGTLLNKKHYKTERFVRNNHRAYLSGKERKTEADIQEVACCVGKN